MLITTKRGRQVPNTESLLYFYKSIRFLLSRFILKIRICKKVQTLGNIASPPSIRKYGQYKLFDSPWNKMIMIGNETDLHYKVVDLMRRYYPDTILVAGLGKNQDTEDKRLDSYKKGYMRG